MKRTFVNWYDFVLYIEKTETDSQLLSRFIAQYCVEWINCIRNEKLSKSNNSSIGYSDNEAISWHSDDIDGRIVAIVKDKSKYSSTTYNDHMIEKDELNKYVELIQKPHAKEKRISLLSVYNDGVIKFTKDILSKASITQVFNNPNNPSESLICYNPDMFIYFYVELIENDVDNNEKYQWTLHYSFEPVDVEMLNRGNQMIPKDVFFTNTIF